MKVQHFKLMIASLVFVLLGFVSTAKADNQYTSPFYIPNGNVLLCTAMNVSKAAITVKINVIRPADGTITNTQEETVQPMTQTQVAVISPGGNYVCKFTTSDGTAIRADLSAYESYDHAYVVVPAR